MEGRSRLDRGMDEIADCRKQLEDLKYLMSEKTRQNMELQDELQRSKRVLDEKFFEAGKLRDEANSKGDQLVDLRSQVAELERDIDLVKSQRADMLREIQRLRDVLDSKGRESVEQQDHTRALEYDLDKTLARIQETERVIDSRSYDIRTKQAQLDDTEREVARVKDLNQQQTVEIIALRKDVDRVSADGYDLRKGGEATEARNADLAAQLRSLDIQLREREESLYGCRKDIENQQYTNQNMRHDLNDYLAEKDALERHSRILLAQNDDLTKELERFVNTDEVLRQQLDRRGRVHQMQERNNRELGVSAKKVYEARSRSPVNKRLATPSYNEISGNRSPPRRFSPLRQSYRPSQNY